MAFVHNDRHPIDPPSEYRDSPNIIMKPVLMGEDSTRSRFVYQLLDLSTDAFRLARIQPTRSPEGLIQLSLWHDNVTSGKYQCLSYEWGPRTHRRTILVNGHSFTVGENLYAFLEEEHERMLLPEARTIPSNARKVPPSGLPIWIDFICINQDSIEERGHQVQRMGKIYAGATDVLIWLGNYTFDPGFLDWLDATLLGRARGDWTCPPEYTGYWDCIQYNSYFSRAWIVQEVLLAEWVYVIISGVAIWWYRLGVNVARSGNLDSYETMKAAQLWSVWATRWPKDPNEPEQPIKEDWREHRERDEVFWELLDLHRNSGCADRRDRIYSILGLVPGGEVLKVDYEETLADLFWRIGEHFSAWDGPELVDSLRIALFDWTPETKRRRYRRGVPSMSPNTWSLVESLKNKPGFCIKIPVRRAIVVKSLTSRVLGSIKCKMDNCVDAPRLPCQRDDVLLCTNAWSSRPTVHGCVHAIAHPKDKPAAEPFEIHLVAHHRKQKTEQVLPSTAFQTYDYGTDTWHGISTWSSLQKAIERDDLDRKDRVKLYIPAIYAIWVWFGVHPDQLHEMHVHRSDQLPSEHHALPPGTKITRESIELPAL